MTQGGFHLPIHGAADGLAHPRKPPLRPRQASRRPFTEAASRRSPKTQFKLLFGIHSFVVMTQPASPIALDIGCPTPILIHFFIGQEAAVGPLMDADQSRRPPEEEPPHR